MAPPRPLAAVTGASSGIGAVYAERLAARGYDLLLIARRLDRLEDYQRQWSDRYHVDVEPLAADLASDAGSDNVAQRLRSSDRLAFLLNNAGFGSRGRLFEIPLDSQDQMHRLHVLATLKLTHAALPGMIARRAGSIVNVSSVAGFSQGVQNVSYCATKAWVNSFTEGVDAELRSIQSPVHVQALCPGFTYTEFHDVLQLDRRKIGMYWMPAEYVVDASLRGLDRGHVFVVPNWRYQLVTTIVPRLPFSLRRRIWQAYGARSRPD